VRTKQILVIGAGIAGCAVALALAKRGLYVTILTSSFDQRAYHAPFIRHDRLEETVRELQQTRQEQLSCSRAHEQLVYLARKSVDELLESHYMVDCNGNIDIHRCLQEQLKQQTNVEWISHHSVVELLTLDQHSLKKADRYKKPACLGVMTYNHETCQMEYFLAKETILATGGAASLFPYSTHPRTSCGVGFAIAQRAGVRLLNMEQVLFHPLGLFEKDRPCFPLPLELLAEGGQLYAAKSQPLEVPTCVHELTRQMYQHLLTANHEHLWLDLTLLDPLALKDKFPAVDAYCLHHGFNIAKDPLPVVPVACHTCGGIAIDRVGQTNLQRLRAIGEVACTGLFYDFKEEALNVLESLTWAIACAEDIAKHINKLVYYFPALKALQPLVEPLTPVVEEDWKLLRQVMGAYVGIRRDSAHLERGCALLEQLRLANTSAYFSTGSIEHIQLLQAIRAAQIIAHTAREQAIAVPYSTYECSQVMGSLALPIQEDGIKSIAYLPSNT
jgi:L-aspartate oxidase